MAICSDVNAGAANANARHMMTMVLDGCFGRHDSCRLSRSHRLSPLSKWSSNYAIDLLFYVSP